MTETAVEIPGYVAGTWAIDPVHSEVSFVVRHMMVSKVRGRFDKFEGTIVTAPDPLQSSVTATVDLSSVNTGEPNRDNHIRSADFFEVESHPTLTFRSTGVRQDGDELPARRRPHHPRHHQAGHPEARGERLRPGRLRRHPGGLLGQRRDQPERLRRQLQRPDPRRAASPSARRSRSPSRSRAYWPRTSKQDPVRTTWRGPGTAWRAPGPAAVRARAAVVVTGPRLSGFSSRRCGLTR